MKVQFNQTTQNYNLSVLVSKNNANQQIKNDMSRQSMPYPFYGMDLVNISSPSFKMNADMKFLLAQSDRLKCAYSGRKMIPHDEAKKIHAKLQKRSNAQSAINYLIQYEDIMHDTECRVFNLLNDAQNKDKKDFQDILEEHYDDALERLKTKQMEILNGTDKIIDTMSEPVRTRLKEIKELTISGIENDTFQRGNVLNAVKKVKAEGNDLSKVIQVYHEWYKFPLFANDLDAFIVKYSKKPHQAIACRLIDTAVATIEHVKPSSCGGEDSLSNYLLVSARFNNARNTMPLGEYIMMNNDIDIRKNLQKYVNDVIKEVNNPKSNFSKVSWYPEAVCKRVLCETSGMVNLNADALKLTGSHVRQNNSSRRLSEKYRVLYNHNFSE